jgi:hypothetical protein
MMVDLPLVLSARDEYPWNDDCEPVFIDYDDADAKEEAPYLGTHVAILETGPLGHSATRWRFWISWT